eukprot:TRINITY_DN111620_c0_g1_i1.p1 TRINITY_DN111620_c0_g1~~TRINITY_DN111620_c0_g1_i1.p1  ORF type:complete len:125 (+),score=23.94 TRINITY_DN111620_c0_g1_i1:82-456(+)
MTYILDFMPRPLRTQRWKMSKHFVAVLTLLRLVQGSSTSDSICPGSGGCRGSGWLDENDSLLDVGMQLLQHKSVARRLQDPQIGQGSTISASTVANVENMFNLKQQQHQQQVSTNSTRNTNDMS